MQDVQASPNGVVEWGAVANAFDKLIRRLEDRQVDGEGLVEVAGTREGGGGGGTAVGGGTGGAVDATATLVTSRIGLDLARAFDISGKPEAWRRGYFEVLSGAARAAERLDGLVVDVKTKKGWPVQYVVGPSNPEPKLLPAMRSTEQPQEENCVRITPPAGEYYEKLLATRGLEAGQVIATELAYSEWLDSIGDHDVAESHIRSALSRSLEATSNPSQVMDVKRGVIKPNATTLTTNILQSATALGVHLASTGQPDFALPIFLSVVRAYRSIPNHQPKKAYTIAFDPSTDLWTLISTYSRNFWSVVEYPPPPPSGNDVLLSRPGDTGCAESAATTYAAEVLFATAPSRRDTALEWTKKAVETAHARSLGSNVKAQERIQCAECAVVGLENWEAMLTKMVAESMAQQSKKKRGSGEERDWKLEQDEYVQTLRRVEHANVPEKVEADKWKLWAFIPTWVLLIM
jgi:hypothetical protein